MTSVGNGIIDTVCPLVLPRILSQFRRGLIAATQPALAADFLERDLWPGTVA
jgi:hypothetical protein